MDWVKWITLSSGAKVGAPVSFHLALEVRTGPAARQQMWSQMDGAVMRVLLVGEGTYPVTRGGVSTWTDQLVRGLPEIDFDVTVLTAGPAKAVYDVPRNVKAVSAIDMWGPVPAKRPIQRKHRVAFEEAWEVICEHAFVPGSRDPRVALNAWLELTRPDLAPRLWWLLNDRRSLALLDTARSRAGYDPTSGHGLVSSMAFVSRMIMPCTYPAVDADIIHVTSLGSAVLAALPSFSQGVPIVLSEHGVYVRERLMALRNTDWPFVRRNLAATFLKSMATVGYEAATTIAPVSDFNGRWAVALGADPRKVRTAYNGVDVDQFRPVAREPAKPTLVFVGRIDPLKDLETLIRAVPRVVESVPDLEVHLIGPVPLSNRAYAEVLQSLIATLGMGEHVRFMGPTTNPVSAYCSGTIAVLSSISEGFPYGALEPMACGRAVVATRVGGVPEAVGECGNLVRSRDPDAFADACVDLLTDTVRRRAVAKSSRQRVVRQFALGRMLDTFRERYLEVRPPAERTSGVSDRFATRESPRRGIHRAPRSPFAPDAELARSSVSQEVARV